MTKDELTADFAARAERATKSPLINWVLSVVTLLLIAIHVFVLVLIVPKFQQMFAEMGMSIPAPTRILLTLSDHCLVSTCMLIIISVILQRAKHRTLVALFNIIVLWLLFGLEVFVLSMPHFSFTDKLNQ